MVEHEAHSVSHVVKEFEFKEDEIQAHVHCQGSYEFPLVGWFIVLEDELDLIVVEPSIILMEGCWKMLVHYSSSHIHMESMT